MKARLAGAVLVLALSARALPGCSCGFSPGQFVGGPALEMPANGQGVAWAGYPGVLERSYVAVYRLRGEVEAERLTVAIEKLSPPWPDHSWPLFLVRPEGGLVPGAQYRFEFGEAPSTGIVSCASIVLVSVATEKLAAQSIPLRSVAVPGLVPQDVATSGGMCSTRILAREARMRLEVPKELGRWTQALLYATVTEGNRRWFPSTSLCTRALEGRSWADGPGEDTVFSVCGGMEGAAYTGPPDFGLGAAPHSVTLKAWLPGTDIVIEGTTSVDLACPVPG